MTDSPAQRAEDQRVVRLLSRRDREFARLARRVGPFAPKRTRDPFRALVGSIIHQQISMSAAGAVTARLQALVPNRRITPQAILATSPAELRRAGLSLRKAEYIRGVAEAFASRQLSARALRAMPDEQIIETVTKLRGVGRWTAEMLLIFCLGRPDVWPVDDLGLRAGIQRFTGSETPPDRKACDAWGTRWRPYRTYVTWYLWRSMDGPREPQIGF